MLYLDVGQVALLAEACRCHTEGKCSADPTIGTCWDADRLDLGRVGKRPDPKFLTTRSARDRALGVEA